MRALIREHRGGQRQAENLAADLADATPAALRGRDGARLARRLTAYVAHTRNHMRSEETVFYGRSERVLEDADWNALLAEATPDDPMGDRALLAKQYPHLAAQLFQPVSDVRGRGDAPPTGDRAPDRARAAIRDGVEQLAELYGELIHDAFAVVRSNLANVQSVRTPWGLVRATGPIGARSCRFVARCIAEPPRLAVATVARFLAAWRPAGTRPGASRNPA